MSINKKNSDGSYSQFAGMPYVTKDNIGLSKVENKSSEDIRGEITSKNIKDALGYTPANDVDEKKSQNDIAVLASRMDGFTKLGEGSTTGDAELEDIRVAYDGKTYSNAGTAVRSQVTELKETIDPINDAVFFHNLFDVETFVKNAERNAITGEMLANSAGYGTSALIPVESGKTVYFSYDGVAFTPTYIYRFGKNGKYGDRLNNKTSLEIGDGYGYISVCLKNDKADKLQIEYDQVTKFEKYGEIPRAAYELSKKASYLYEGITPNPLDIIKETPGYTSIFLKVGCIGDSLASGLSTGQKDGQKYNLNLYQHSWGQYMARMTGNTYYNFSVGGLSTRTWLTSQYATQCFDGDHNCTAYIIGLGQNDYNQGVPIGTIADIKDNYNDNPDTYYGNYGKIIQKLKEMYPGTKPKIFIVTDPLQAIEDAGYNAAVRAIADKYDNVWLIDMYTYGKDVFTQAPFTYWKRDAHYNAPAYLYCAYMMSTYIDWIIKKHPDWFKNVELIDTEYSYYSTEKR